MRDKISACVLAYNEEKKVARCLESLTWCDEIIVFRKLSRDEISDIVGLMMARLEDQLKDREINALIEAIKKLK